MNKATNNMFKQGLLAMLVVLVSAGSALAQQSLFFSEFIEGGGNNKAFEIYNPTAEAVDLGNYIVLGNYNGNPFNDTLRFPMGTMLESMDVYVVAHADADAAITDVADSLVQNPYGGGSSFIAVFNGDDARALVHIQGTDSTIVDMFGTTEEDPGSGWDVAGVSS
jgi:predicted extracellular nuclease